MLAGLLYLGSGGGLMVLYVLRRKLSTHVAETPLQRPDVPWLAGAVLFGGVLGPLLAMMGLRMIPASTSSLLLNMEGVFTAGLAWFVFHENFDRRIAVGMVFILAGSLVLSWQGNAEAAPLLGSVLVVAACLCWGLDNNFTQKVSASDPFQVTAIKGLVAGAFNVSLALALGNPLPALSTAALSAVVGVFGYGISLACFVLALRQIGTARTGAYFALAPFIGAILSVLVLGEPASPALLAAGLLMGLGVWIHLTERHDHKHVHPYLKHSHGHVHDEHHEHAHAPGVDVTEPHTHEHEHQPMTHTHPHLPDIHHRHSNTA